MFELRANLIGQAKYPRELIWAPSYLGNNISFGGIPDLNFPHAHNVDEVREFIDNVCEYLDVEVVDIIAHSLGCTLAYSVFRGLSKQIEGPNSEITSWSWAEPKKWHRVGTFIALAGAFRGLVPLPGESIAGEWTPGGEFMSELLAEDLAGDDETPYGQGKAKTPGPLAHNITYFCGVAKGDYSDNRSPDTRRSTSMLEGAVSKVYNYARIVNGKDVTTEWEKHERIIKDPVVVQDVKALLTDLCADI